MNAITPKKICAIKYVSIFGLKKVAVDIRIADITDA
jgi:hypothetical protein